MTPRGRIGDFDAQRSAMVDRQLRRRGISDPRVLEAMGAVPRELFVLPEARDRAYADSALPIGGGQTISQPWIVAAICEALELRGEERVLEIGTGSGYSAAVLGHLAAEVVTIELVAELSREAARVLGTLGIANVEVVTGDGTRGAPERAPFEGIAVHATAPAPPASLLGQLATDGLLVAPVAEQGGDVLTAFRRTGEPLDLQTGRGLERRAIAPCRFVPLLGEEGYDGG